ncbi:11634_t:CDS:2 [Paraglomus brasilianum]|uniref:11634_t:CDS:1 n=1 Tax=Paraglomus brasilianum TaxID=144538 RepID=A0A9N9H227_9GLOM|nr:11634_t:CDS:2 [Paraglomus brasilianum]
MSKYKVHFSESKVLSFNVRKFTSETTVQDDAMKLFERYIANALPEYKKELLADDGLHNATMGPCELEDSILYSDMTIEEKDAKLCKVTKLYRDNIQYI